MRFTAKFCESRWRKLHTHPVWLRRIRLLSTKLLGCLSFSYLGLYSRILWEWVYLSGIEAKLIEKCVNRGSSPISVPFSRRWAPLSLPDRVPHCPKRGTDAGQDSAEPLGSPLSSVPVYFCSPLREEEYNSWNGWHLHAVPGRQCCCSPLVVGQYREWPQSRVSRGLFICFIFSWVGWYWYPGYVLTCLDKGAKIPTFWCH